jgi:peptidyl-prolyl cis-trans isomerase SurA
MTLRSFCIPAALVFGTVLLASPTLALAQNSVPQSPYGGATVEDIIARVNDQIITQSDYDRALAEVDQESRQRGATSLQEIAAAHKDLLRNLIDQQLWLSKGKELDITGDTELVKRLDEIRKQYHLDSIDDLEKAAKEQGVSFEDFKANIRNGIITQDVMRQEVGARLQITPGEAERYFEQHKQDYAQPESVRLSEILISTGTSSDPAKQAAAKSKADDIEARLHAGGDFSQLSKSFSDGPTAASGGDLGEYQRGALPKVLEDKTFPLKAGQITDPILTRQGYIILKVVEHVPGGPRPYKEVEDQVDEAFYMSQMEPAIRAYLTKLREDAFIDIKPGYVDSGASPNETKPVYSAYTPPAPKKKAKVERTRFRETTHTFRQKSPEAQAPPPPPSPAPPAAATVKPVKTSFFKKKHGKSTDQAIEKPGKKEKIRYGQKPRETLPAAPNGTIENAGALPETASTTSEPVNPLEATAPTQKTRFSARAKVQKQPKPKGPQADALAPAPPDAAEVADRETQSGPLGLAGNTAVKKKKKSTTTTSEKTRLANQKKEPGSKPPAPQFTPAPQEPGAPAPTPQPSAPAPQQQ